MYCPKCESEYQDSVKTCPDDGAVLVLGKPEKTPKATAVDVYAAAGEIEAERIVSYLNDEGIRANRLRSEIAQYPSSSTVQYRITVNTVSQSRAVKLIKQAIEDGIITNTGAFL